MQWHMWRRHDWRRHLNLSVVRLTFHRIPLRSDAPPCKMEEEAKPSRSLPCLSLAALRDRKKKGLHKQT